MASEIQEKSQPASETINSSIIERVGFSYKPPQDPLEAAHEREMSRSREQFRRKMVLTQVIAAMIIGLFIIGIFGYVIFQER